MTAPPLDIRYHPDVLPDPDDDLRFLLSRVDWDTGMRARRTASFGLPYNYSGRRYDPADMPPRLAVIAGRAAEFAGHPFNNRLANLYETGGNTMGFHQDSYQGLVTGSAIAIVSLGAPRRLVFRSLDRVHRAELVLDHGSLLLMTAATQRAWAHAVPRDHSAGPRVSLTFRRFETAPGTGVAGA